MILYDLERFGTIWDDFVEFIWYGTSLSEHLWTHSRTFKNIRTIGVSYRELSPAEITNTSLLDHLDHLPSQSRG